MIESEWMPREMVYNVKLYGLGLKSVVGFKKPSNAMIDRIGDIWD